MAESFVQLLDNAGVTKLIRTWQQTTSGNLVDQQAIGLVDQFGNPINADPTFNALRVTARPFEVLGVYSIGETTGAYTGIAAGGELFQFRWTDASKLAIILRVSVSVAITAAATTAGAIDRQLIIARSWSASGSGGTALTPSGSNLKRRTSFPTSVVGDIRIASNAALSVGTKTLDSSGVGIAGTGIGTAAITSYQANQVLPKVDLYNVSSGGISEYPIVLAQNEGIVVRMPTAQPSGSTLKTLVDCVWAEVAAF